MPDDRVMALCVAVYAALYFELYDMDRELELKAHKNKAKRTPGDRPPGLGQKKKLNPWVR